MSKKRGGWAIAGITLKYPNRSFLQTNTYLSSYYILFTKLPLEGDRRPARKSFPFVFQSQPGWWPAPFSVFIYKMGVTESVRGNYVFIWENEQWAAVKNAASLDKNPVPPPDNWLIVLWMKTDIHKMGNDRWTPPLINIYMWMMRLNSASPVCTGALATRVAAQCTGHYFIWDLMSAEFIRGSRFPVDGRILFAANGFSLLHICWETCRICHVFVETPGIQTERNGLNF